MLEGSGRGWAWIWSVGIRVTGTGLGLTPVCFSSQLSSSSNSWSFAGMCMWSIMVIP
jgi:hypothetical protein